MLVAGVAFIVPAAVMVTLLAWVYVEQGDTPAVEGLLYGVVPVVVAVVVWAIVGLGRTVLSSWWLALLAGIALAAYLLGVNELVVLFAGAALVAAVRGVRDLTRRGPAALALPLLVAGTQQDGRLTESLPHHAQDRRRPLRQRLRAAGLPRGRLRRPARLGHPPAGAGRDLRRAGDAGPGVHDRDLPRLRRGRAPGRLPGDGGDLPAVVRVRRAAHPAHRLAALAGVDQRPARRRQRHRARADGRRLAPGSDGPGWSIRSRWPSSG
nr:chromate transporter [Nocardioides convexus]